MANITSPLLQPFREIYSKLVLQPLIKEEDLQ
jgi:hypothetical protein